MKKELEDIRKILEKHYGNTDSGRKLITFKINSVDKTNNTPVYFFMLAGSPPKGYGIFIKELNKLCLYDVRGKRFKEYSSTDFNLEELPKNKEKFIIFKNGEIFE